MAAQLLLASPPRGTESGTAESYLAAQILLAFFPPAHTCDQTWGSDKMHGITVEGVYTFEHAVTMSNNEMLILLLPTPPTSVAQAMHSCDQS